jgi:hypothetical protein
MFIARDAEDGRYERHEGRAARWYEEEPRPLSLVRPPALAFELVVPEDFETAQRIADRLREGVPVLIDLHRCDDVLAGRLTDFASGLVYALGGTLQDVAREVLLLTPREVFMSGDEACAVRSPGFYNRS